MKNSCKAYSKKELCKLYGVSLPTLKKWVKHLVLSGKIDIRKRVFTPKEVVIIFEELGNPFA